LWREGEVREYFKCFVFGSNFMRGEKRMGWVQNPSNGKFLLPEIGGIWRGGEVRRDKLL
jgi:hypothetical protein